MYQVSISGYHLTNVSHGKPFYVYTVECIDSNNGAKYLTEKRYSEFSNLHRVLKKDSHNVPFPPKRVRNSNPKVLEHRRITLEVYLQKMCRLPTAQQRVLNFLGIVPQKGMQSIFEDQSSLLHHPVLTFQSDPYVQANESSSLPDIVTQGVLLGIYKS